MATFNDYLDECRPGVHSAPDVAILSALRRAAQRFCRDSRIWRERLEDIVYEPAVNEYDLPAPDGATVEEILWARSSGNVLSTCSAEAIFTAGETVEGTPQAVALKSLSNTCLVWPTPEGGSGTLGLYVVLAPSRTANEVPDQLADRWHDAIIAGARAELMSTIGMPWSNPQEAERQTMIFWDFVAEARREATSGRHAELRIAPHRFL